MVYVVLVLSLIAILMAWLAHRKNSDLRERLAQTNSRIYHVRRENEEVQEKVEQELKRLKFEILKLQGDLRVAPEMKIGEIIAVHPQAQQVLAGFHLGGCAGCYVDEDQTLLEAVAVNGRELEPILVALNILATETANGDGPVAPARLKTPNVQLQF